MAEEKPDSFVREVDEELKREQLQQLWDQYGLLIVGSVMTLLAAVWGYTHWQSRRASNAELYGARYEEAARLARDGKTEEAAKAFTDIAKGAAPGYQALAQLRIAAIHAKAGRKAEAVAIYDAMTRDASIDAIVRDLAGVHAASLRLADADYAEMQKRLATLTLDSSPWRTAARETLGLAAYKAGKYDDAKKLFDQLLVDRTAPPGLSERVQLMLAVLTDAEGAKAAPAVLPPGSKDAAPAQKTKDKSATPPPGQQK